MLSRECSDRRDLVDRFFAEAKAVNLIRHESIVNVLDLSTLPDGRPYIVMEYLDGSPLSAIVEQARHAGPLPLGGLARLVAEVLDALGAAHAKGIIHRDLKPDNIYVTPGGRAKVLDFGIAKLQPELGGSATHTGSLLGTPHYMSPEQASGRHVDLRADLYAIGVILFECATLQKPFLADSLFDLLRKHVEAPPPSPRALRPDMPEGLEHVIYTALAKLPEQRFASAQAMSMALQHATMSLPQQQWAPIVPATGSRVMPGGWQPTPPASWAGSQRPSFAVGPTTAASAGQVTQPQPRPRGSKKGLLIALASLVVVGGGITAAVLATRGGKTDAVAQNGSNGSSGSATPGSAGPGPTDQWATPGSADTPAPPTTPQQPPDEETPAPGDLPDDVAAQMDETVGEMIDSLPPESRKALPPELTAALKKYGRWSKIPKLERAKLLAKLGGMAGMIGNAGNTAANALAGDAPPAAPARKQPAAGSAAVMAPGATAAASTAPAQIATAPAGAGLGADGWVVPYRTMPGGYNPKSLSVEKLMPQAIARAKKLVPDAVLFRIDTDGVYPDGHADITLSEHGSIDFRFISPSRKKGDPKLPVGAKQEFKCMFRVMYDGEGQWSAPLTGWECDEPLLGPPTCSIQQIWKKALAKGAPQNAIAEIGYRGWDNKARWYFDINGTKFSEMFDDDCSR